MIHFLRLRKYPRNTLRLRLICGLGKLALMAVFTAAASAPLSQAQTLPVKSEICPRFPAGSTISSPEDLRSRNGKLKVHLRMRNFLSADGEMRYCYVNADGSQAPTLRLHPGDLLVLDLKNELSLPSSSMPSHADAKSGCGSGMLMTAAATNLHFHGLYLPPLCHQDETLGTLLQPSSHPFKYKIRIPLDQPPGLYWYHPHPHGFSEAQVLGGASGALIVEGIERANSMVAGMPERVLIIRDQKLPGAGAPTTLPADQRALLPEKPSKDLSINFIPVPYPKYPTAMIGMKPNERQFWRVLNASADTHLDLQLVFDRKAQKLGVVALDGVPVGDARKNPDDRVVWQFDIPIPAGGRAEFIVTGPPDGVRAKLVTLGVETAPFVDEDDLLPVSGTDPNAVLADDDDNTPPRPLATIIASATAEPFSRLPAEASPLRPTTLPTLVGVNPVRQRKLYFSEKVLDPKHPNTSTIFFITEEGKTPAVYDPASTTANISVHQGDVEDWTIENRSQELHTFHIHQSHFVVLKRDGDAVDEPNLRDTISVRFWDGKDPQYPSVILRMDFRDPNIVGTFPYHCHILQHEDGGMMGTIQVLPAAKASK
jgi:FtsP/CotA-like multicopper oxidase with cupredoxin domain